MRKFAEAYADLAFVQEVLAQITRYHNSTVMEKVYDHDERNWYIGKPLKMVGPGMSLFIRFTRQPYY